MTTFTTRIRAYADLTRISNLPTCVSNVLVGCAIGAMGSAISWPTIAGLSVAIALLYIGGMAMNDVVDVASDRESRPHRPIVAGLVPLNTARLFTAVTLIAGLALLVTFGMYAMLFGAALVASIAAYNLLHKRTPIAAVFMGLCRSLVYIVAATAIAWPINWSIMYWFAGTILLYILTLTFIARSEDERTLDKRKWLATAMPIIALLPLWRIPIVDRNTVFVPVLLLMVWLGIAASRLFRDPPQTKHTIMMWLSGICLLDAMFLTLLQQPQLAVVAGVCFIVTVLGHTRIMGT